MKMAAIHPAAMVQALEGRFPVKIRQSTDRGRHVVAARDLVAGQIILMSSAAALAPMTPIHLCAFCLQPSANGQTLRCSGCKAKHYCGAACQRADWADHKLDCKHAMFLHTQMDLATKGDMMLLGRLQNGRWLRGQDAPLAGAIYHHTAEDVMAMQSPSTDASGQHGELSKMKENRMLAMVRKGVEIGLLRCTDEPGSAASTANAANGTAGGDLASMSTEAGLLKMLSAFECNNFFTCDELLVGRAASVHPAGALLNHSCVPNAMLTYVSEAEANAAWEGRPLSTDQLAALPPQNRAPRIQVIRTLVHVKAGQELCHSYVDAALPRAQRMVHLLSVYGFNCTCPACTAPAGSPFDTDRFLLSTADGQRQAVVGVPTPMPDPENPEGGEIIYDNYETLTEPEAALVKRARDILKLCDQTTRLFLESSGGAGHPGKQKALQGAVKKLHEYWQKMRKEYAALLKDEGSSGSNAAAGSSAPAFSATTVSTDMLADAEAIEAEARTRHEADLYDRLLIQHAEAEGRLDPFEGGFEMIATRALEMAVLSLRTLLHPLHVLVMQAVNALHNRYIMFSDMSAVAAAGEHIVTFHRHVYSALGSTHPMLGLQLYTQGDCYRELSAWAGGASSPGGEGLSEGTIKLNKKRLELPQSRVTLLKHLFVRYDGPQGGPGSASGAAAGGGGAGCGLVLHVHVSPVDIDTTWTQATEETARMYARKALAAYRESAHINECGYGKGSHLVEQALEAAGPMARMASEEAH